MTRAPSAGGTAAELRERWAARSASIGWAYAEDWPTGAVDAVCEAVVARCDVIPAAERLGRDRAAAGVSLGEALTDVDALAGLAPVDAEILRRAVSLGWADQIAAPADSVTDALTGLASAEYLRIRLGEVYRAAELEGCQAADTHALVVVRLSRPEPPTFLAALPMILVGDALRAVFGGGQSLVRVGTWVAVALTERDATLARRARLTAEMVASWLAGDDPESIVVPQVWVEALPTTHRAAIDLVAELGR